MTSGITSPPGQDRRRRLGTAAALFLVGAGAIHLSVVPAHLDEYVPYGVFFVAAALAQWGLAVALIRSPSRPLAVAALGVSLALVVLWVVSRTAGLPISPRPWVPEDVGISDLAATLIELVATVLLVVLALRPLRRRRPRWRFPIGVVPAAAGALLLTTFGTIGAFGQMTGTVDMSATVPAGQAPTPISSLTQPPGSEPLRTYTLVAEPSRANGATAWSFNGTVPGPVLRANEGDRLRVTLVNHLAVATSIHWHGVAVPNAEDGVAGVTQDAVPPGHVYTYEFVVKQAGTFWYHSHQDTANQLVQGLFGALVVLPRTGEVADYDYPLIVHEASGANRLSPGLQGYVNLFAGGAPAINGQTRDQHLEAPAGARVRLRIIGAVEGETDGILRMNGVPRKLVLVGAPYRVVALDGNDVSGPQTIGPEKLPIAIGGRCDLEFTMPASGEVRVLDANGGETVTIGSGLAPAAPAFNGLPSFDQLSYGTPAPDAVTGPGHFDVTYPMVLDDTDGTSTNTIQLVHTINGKSSPMMASYVVREGQVVRLHMVNLTDEYHAMHLHGHSFSVLDRNGRRPTGSPVHLDTLIVGPNETWDIAFIADNPGLWMFHCHVLVHAAWGMSAMLVYEGVTTPYRLGANSVNKPE